MALSRNILLWMSENQWMKTNVPKFWFVKKAIKKFMPGETELAAMNAAVIYSKENIYAVFTKLGENINHISEAVKVRDHYLELIDKIAERQLDIEISLKLTQLGFDISEKDAYEFCKEIAHRAKQKLNNTLFVDMEGSAYTQRTLDFFKRLRNECSNVGLCIQAYLYRTEKDLENLMQSAAAVRLVKGAYKESPEIAFPNKEEVDKNYLSLARRMIRAAKENKARIVFATHDEFMIDEIIKEAGKLGLKKNEIEFQMLYGIKTDYLKNLARQGCVARVLIAYGNSWYPWYMRRLAERPANVWFVIKNIF